MGTTATGILDIPHDYTHLNGHNVVPTAPSCAGWHASAHEQGSMEGWTVDSAAAAGNAAHAD